MTNVAAPVTVTQAACEILRLDFGAIHLDVLGLQVNLSPVLLELTAQSGAGNLLGNLLCAVTGLLDQPNALAKLLNDILNAIA